MKHFKRFVASLLALLLLCGFVPAASAEEAYEVTDGECTYRIENGEAELIHIEPEEMYTDLMLDSDIAGYPITKIASNLLPALSAEDLFHFGVIVIPETVRVIAPRAFSGAVVESSLFLSEGLEEVGDEAFRIGGMTNITLPRSLQTIGKDAFALTDLAFDGEGNPYYNYRYIYVYQDGAAYRYFQSLGMETLPREQADGSVIGEYANLNFVRYPDNTVKLVAFEHTSYYFSALPSFIEGCPVTAIGRNALRYTDIRDGYVILPMFVEAIDSTFLANKDGEGADGFIVFYYPTEFTRNYFANMPFEGYSVFLGLERPFTDVADDDWYFDAASFAYYFGLFNGTSETEFSPKAQMTRAMLVTVLYRLDGGTAEGNNPFSDVPADKYYTDAVIWASENGIVNGVGNGRFDPDGKITREQIATILYRYTERLITPSSGAPLDGFPDVGNVSDYAKRAMQWAVGEKLIGGRNAGGVAYLSPKDGATRAEVAQILMRYVIGP